MGGGGGGDSPPVPTVPTALNKRAGCLHFFTMQFCWHFHCQPIDKSTKSKVKKISWSNSSGGMFGCQSSNDGPPRGTQIHSLTWWSSFILSSRDELQEFNSYSVALTYLWGTVCMIIAYLTHLFIEAASWNGVYRLFFLTSIAQSFTQIYTNCFVS